MPSAPDPSIDLISTVFASLRTERAVTAHFALSAPWSLRSDGVDGLLIRVCTGPPFHIATHSQDEPVEMQAGDIALLRPEVAHTMSSSPGLPPEPIGALVRSHLQGEHGEHPMVFAHGGGGPVTDLFSLHLWMDAYRSRSLLYWLPPLVVLRSHTFGTTRSLAFATQSLVEETLAQRPGWQLATARMADLLLLHVVRTHLQSTPSQEAGWLRGLQDPAVAAALHEVHARPSHAWSVEEMARLAGQSRSTFSARFQELMGISPMRHVTDVRMAAAADLLRDGERDLWALAQASGYDSDKAFARAFERWSGLTPSRYIGRWTIGASPRRPGS